MRPSRGVDKLPSDPHSAACLPHTTFQDVAHSKLTPDLLNVYRAALVGKARIAGDDKQPTHSRQGGDDLLYHAVCKVLLVAGATQVIEWQDSDGRFVG